MKITPLKNPGDEIKNRRPAMTEECQHFCKQTDELLQAFGKQCGGVELRMGKLGLTCFRLHKFTIVVEVPHKDSYLKVYTMIYRTKSDDPPELRMTLMKSALEFNYLQKKTFGACLSLDPCPHKDEELEFNVSQNHNLIGLNAKEFNIIMMNFMQTTKEIYTALMIKAHLPVDMNHFTEDDFDRIPPKPKRQVWVHFPKDHPRDLKMLYDADLEQDEERVGKNAQKKRAPRQQPRLNLQLLQNENKAIVIPRREGRRRAFQ